MNCLEAAYDSPAGEYYSAWKIKDKTHVHRKYKVPFGCPAELKLPYLSDIEAEHLSDEMHISAEGEL